MKLRFVSHVFFLFVVFGILLPSKFVFAAADTNTQTFIEPKLNVQVPELTFSKTLFGPCSYDPSQKCVQSSTLGDYINALYKFLLNGSILIAIVMIMIGGLQYVLGAASEAQVNKGKERMTNAVTGLVLLLCVFLILKNVNPQLVSLKMVQLQNIPEEGLGNNEVTDLSDANASYPPVIITAGQLPKFKQCGSEWKNIPYKGVNGATVICGPSKHVNANHEDNICESGCGPVSVAVVLGYYGQNVSPPIVANYASEIGAHAACTSGTNVNLLCSKIAAKWSSMTCKGISPNDTKAIANYLTQKKPIIFSCAGCTGKKADGSDQKYRGHFMVLTGVSGNQFTVFDVGKLNGITTIPMTEFTSGKVKSSYLIQKK